MKRWTKIFERFPGGIQEAMKDLKKAMNVQGYKKSEIKKEMFAASILIRRALINDANQEDIEEAIYEMAIDISMGNQYGILEYL